MPRAERLELGSALGADLGNVRIHTDRTASRAAQGLGALAFTYGSHIVFDAGAYDPSSSAGQRLLAHELTHTVQQSRGIAHSAGQPATGDFTVSTPADPDEAEAERAALAITTGQTFAVHSSGGATAARIAREAAAGNPPPAQTAPTATEMDDARKAAEAVLKDLRGYTGWSASGRIVGVFTSRSASAGRLIVQELKRRAPEEKRDAKGMMAWLFGDLTAEDAGKLRQWFIDNRIIEDVADMVADEILGRLKGWTSEDDSHEILQRFEGFMSRASAGADVDTLLSRLETKTKLDPRAMATWLFGDLDRVTAWKLGDRFYQVGTPRAVDYAATWSAGKIYDLLAGFTSHSDSSDIVKNFQLVQPTSRNYVYFRLDEITRAKRNQEAVDALMSDMDKSDYLKLQTMEGLHLRDYKHEVPWYKAAAEWVVGALDWASIVAQWVVCGAIGIITGLLSVVWDFVVLIKDIVVAVWDILWAIVYLVSGGGAGSAEFLKVKQFILGIGHAVAHPLETFSQMWDELKLEIKTIEGPLSDCRIAELIVRKVVNGIVNVILIFAAGYGLVKLGASALKAAAEFVDLVKEVGLIKAVGKVGGVATEAIAKALGSVSGKLAKVAKALVSPIETLARLRGELTTLVMAARNEGYWAFLRRQAGMRISVEAEWWRKNHAFWEERAAKQQAKALGLEADADKLAADAVADKEPPPTQLTAVQNDVGKLEGDVNDLKKDVIGEEAPTAPAPKPLTPPEGPGAWTPVEESMSERAAAYQARITGAPRGSAYVVDGVKFDGFKNGVLQEAKGPGYANFVRNGQFRPWYTGADELVAQAQRQLAVAGKTPILWSVAEEEAAKAIQNLFGARGVTGINVVFAP